MNNESNLILFLKLLKNKCLGHCKKLVLTWRTVHISRVMV